MFLPIIHKHHAYKNKEKDYKEYLFFFSPVQWTFILNKKDTAYKP